MLSSLRLVSLKNSNGNKRLGMEEMNRLKQAASLIKEKYSKKDEHEDFLVAGRFTLEEMLQHRSFYRQENNNEELFVPFDTIDIDAYYDHNFEKNITEFFAFLMMSDLEIWRFLIDKERQNKK